MLSATLRVVWSSSPTTTSTSKLGWSLVTRRERVASSTASSCRAGTISENEYAAARSSPATRLALNDSGVRQACTIQASVVQQIAPKTSETTTYRRYRNSVVWTDSPSTS